MQDDKSLSFLFARLDDLYRSADQGLLGGTSFLSPRDLHFAKRHLASVGALGRTFEFGGYADAERKKLFILPEYMDGVKEYREILEYGFESEFSAVEVRGSGYRSLSHRDFLGSVLGLGLERSVIGDILVYDEEKPRALIICDVAVSDFISGSLTKIGSDTVNTRVVSIDSITVPERRFSHVTDTVASARLDGVVAAITSLSRERAKELVAGGFVELDYEPCERPDKVVAPPALITVRGYGKFRINALSDKTKKGRVRLDADKFV